jgi:hypothetical protein
MGGGSWSSDAYDDRTKVRNIRTSTHGPAAAFAHTHAVNTGAAARAVHPKLDPKLVAGPSSPFAGKVMRESRDSADHPESLPIAVFFDETGSMGGIPVVLEKKLAGLMALLVQKGIAHPQILFGAIGDANPTGHEAAPLQVGQFESDVLMDDVLDNVYLEGNGGGQHHETYELAHYFVGHHTATDAWDKRGKKGYLFTVGDEAPYAKIRRDQVKRLIGDDLESDITIEEVFKEVQERWHVFHIIAEEGSYRDNPGIEKDWRDLLGERVLKLYDSANVAEVIAMTIALTEGVTDDVSADLVTAGADQSVVTSVSTALATYAKSAGQAMAKANVTGTLPSVAGGTTQRL